MTASTRPHVVIVGAGFGGLAAAKALRHAAVDVTLIDKRNHHLFQPLLYQVATAGLSPADIAAPIRSIVKKNRNTRVLLDSVIGVDAKQKHVILSDHAPIGYDWLIVATGARHSYFGRDEWASVAPGIKTIDDATAIRRKVLLALERAETERDEARRKALLTFVVIGGGPTGVEMAGAIAELAHLSASSDFRNITPHCSRIVLLDAGDRLLPSFPAKLSARTKAAIENMGVEVKLGSLVTDVREDGVLVGDDFIPAFTAIWAAGVEASPAAKWLRLPTDSAGRALVGRHLKCANSESIFIIGDTAACMNEDGRPLPGVAPVAKQQGEYAAAAILAGIAGRRVDPFRYRNYGNLATIGRKRAVADFGRLHVTGFAAWILWCVAHIWFLSGFRNRFVVGANWLWNYLTFERSARLITGDISQPPMPAHQQSMATNLVHVAA